MIQSELKNYGFVAPQIEADHFVLGSARSLPVVILQADGQWDQYMPVYEPQFGDGWDTDGCTVWGTLNAIEFLFKKIFATDANFSERFIYNLVPVLPPGSDPHKVAETIREHGSINNSLLPMTETFEEFCTPRPMSDDLSSIGVAWLSHYNFGHEWVFKSHQARENRIALMKQALQYSPLGVSVTAWLQGNEGVYVDNGQPNCHWPVCYGWDDEKQAWKIFDSYDQSTKLYSFDSAIEFCKRYALAPVQESSEPVTPNWFTRFCESLFGFQDNRK